jgi:hypothetical protein
MPLALHAKSWKIFDAIVNMLLIVLLDYSSKQKAFFFFKELIYFYHFQRYYKNIKQLLLIMSEGYQRHGESETAILFYLNALQYTAVEKDWEVSSLGTQSHLRQTWHTDAILRSYRHRQVVP